MNRGQTAKTENVVFLTDFVTHGLVQPLFHHRRSFFFCLFKQLVSREFFQHYFMYFLAPIACIPSPAHRGQVLARCGGALCLRPG